MILAGCDTFDREMSSGVSLRHTQHRLLLEGGVGEVAVESHEDTFHRLEILGTDDIARHLKGIDMIPRGEGVGVVAKGVALIVVTDGTGEVDGIGRVSLERVDELTAMRLPSPLISGASSCGGDTTTFSVGLSILINSLKLIYSFFLLTFVAPSAGSAPMTFGGVSSYQPPSGLPMRAQPCSSASVRTAKRNICLLILMPQAVRD